MKLVPYNRNNITTGGYKRTKNYNILLEFIESGMDCAKVEGFTNAKPAYCATSLQQSIRKFKFNNIRCVGSKGEVFLIRTGK